MKKRIMAAWLTVIVSALTLHAQVIYDVKGTVPANADMVYLLNLTTGRPTAVDKVIPRDGHFAFKGEAPENYILGLMVGEYYMPFFNDGVPVVVNLEERTLKGSELNQRLVQVDNEMDLTVEESGQETIEKRIDLLRRQKNTLIPIVYLPDLANYMTLEQIKEFVTPDAPYAQHPTVKPVMQVLANLEKKAPGRAFTDFTMPDMNGDTRQLSEWVGKDKVVLLDFWASWCGPCRKEMPTVVESYARFKDKGYEIVGVSLDKDANAWKAAVSQLNMTWPQLSDLKYWQCSAAGLYGVQAIPSNVLIGKDGRIIASDLRGDRLLQVLEETIK